MFNHMFRTIFWVWMAALAALTLYLLDAWADAARDAPTLRTEAADIIAAGRGPGALGPGQLDLLLLVEDPAFYDHNGLDLTTPGAGMTSIPQSLAKRLAFDKFRPGISKLRQTAYAISLTRRLTREDILALALDKAEMGPGPEGWVTGFFQASEAFYGRSPAELKDREFMALVAALIAPANLSPINPNPALEARIDRIARLAEGQCAPRNHSDVWLEGCA